MTSTFVPAVNGAYVALQFTQADGEFCQIGMWVERDEAWTVPKLQDVASAAAGGWNTPVGGSPILKDVMSAHYSLIQTTARDFTTETSPSVVHTDGLPIAGEGGTPAIPSGLAFCVTLRTGLSGRNYRGRVYIPGFTNSDFDVMDQNILSAASAANMVGGVKNIIATLNASDGGHNQVVICSRTSKVENPVAPYNRATAVMTPVTDAGYHDLFADFQRRRAPAHNRHH